MSRLKLMSSPSAVEAIANDAKEQMRQANRMTEFFYVSRKALAAGVSTEVRPIYPQLALRGSRN